MKNLKLLLFSVLAAALFAIVISSCSKEQLINDPIDLKQAGEASPSDQATTRTNDSDLCHWSEEDGTWHMISVNYRAVAAHIAHGDVLLVDADGDGWVEALNECVPGGDCDDSDEFINPGAEEIPYNGKDDDCNPATPDDDLDGDGFLNADDCDDGDASINPGVEEICDNGVDDNCDGEIDEGCSVICYPEIFCEDVISGSTVAAAPATGLNVCGASRGGAVWYSFTGTGNYVTMETCGNASYDTVLGVYTGCGPDFENYIRVTCNDDALGCGFRSLVTFFAEAGVEYSIYVSGFATAAGDFELSVSCGAPEAAPSPEMNIGDIVLGDVSVNATNQEASLDISVPQNTVGLIQIYDSRGQLAQIEKVILVSGANTLPLKLKEVPSGDYNVTITIEGNEFNKKLLKQ